MRKEVFVVWVDDEISSPFVKNIQRIVARSIEAKGYTCKMEKFSSIEEANNYFLEPHNKVDLFIIDYNIDDTKNKTGFDYLSDVRKSGKYRQYFVLYSNNDDDVIKEELKKVIGYKDLSELSNFEIISLANSSEKTNRFNRAVDIALSWWDELNALRGIITAENGKFDFYARKLLEFIDCTKDWFDYDSFNYKRVINELKKYCKRRSIFTTNELNTKFENWHKLRQLRNDCAHAVEKFDDISNKFYLENPITNEHIFENDLMNKRHLAIRLSEDVESIIEKAKTFYGCSIVELV